MLAAGATVRSRASTSIRILCSCVLFSVGLMLLQAERWGWGPAVARVRRQYGRAIRIHRRRMATWTPFSSLTTFLKVCLAAGAWLLQQPLRALSGSITWTNLA